MATLEDLVLALIVGVLVAVVMSVAVLSLEKIKRYLLLEETGHEKRREEISRRRKAILNSKC
jgi:hypothetical protein